MSPAPVIIALPIADRRRSFAFYGAGLGLKTVGEIADDGVPEPLQIELHGGVRVMLIPADGFGWVIGGRDVAPPGQTECVLTLTLAVKADVDDLVERARLADAQIITAPGDQPWGYAAVFADPDGHLWQICADDGGGFATG